MRALHAIDWTDRLVCAVLACEISRGLRHVFKELHSAGQGFSLQELQLVLAQDLAENERVRTNIRQHNRSWETASGKPRGRLQGSSII